MTVLITLTIAGTNTGPFDLYSDVDGFLVPFENNVPKASLVSGYTSVLVPAGTTVIRVKSDSVCINYIDLIISGTTTTTSSTSTTTSTSTSTTTTTTTTTYPCECVRLQNTTNDDLYITITPCITEVPFPQIVPGNNVVTECVVTGSVENPAPIGIIVTYCPDVPENPPCNNQSDCGTCGAS